MIGPEMHALIRSLLAQGMDPAQVAAQLGVDAAQVVGIAPSQPQAPTSAIGQPIYRHRKYQREGGPAGGDRTQQHRHHGRPCHLHA